MTAIDHIQPDSVIASGPSSLPARPYLPPVLHTVWRDAGILQIGLDPDRAVVLHGISPAHFRFIGLLDGFHSLAQLMIRARHLQITPPEASQLLRRLRDAGVLIDLGETPQRDLLDAEFTGRALGAPRQPFGEAAARRASSLVVVRGARRLGAVIANTLCGAGIGAVHVQQSGIVDRSDVTTGGFRVGDVGQSRNVAIDQLLGTNRAGAGNTVLDPARRPDLVVLTDPWPPPDEDEHALQLAGVHYLCASIRERRAIIGPFVIPRESSCLQCQYLHRADRDDRWFSVFRQLRLANRSREDAGESSLNLIGAGLAVAQALQWLDGERIPETVNATLEIALPGLLLQRRFWPRHPRCTCSSRSGD